MDRNHLRILMQLSTALLLAFTSACSSDDSETPFGNDTGGVGSRPGTGGDSNPGVGGAGSHSPITGGTGPVTGGTGPVTGGTGPITGGTAPITGGTAPVTGGSSPITGGTGPATGGRRPVTGGSGPGTGGALPGTGGAGVVTSNFPVDVEVSTAIPTVGIATWSLDAQIDSATIAFGRDQSNFEYEAPVDLGAPNHRTLLLGMKQNTTYYVRVTVNSGGQAYQSQVATVTTGYLANGQPIQTITDTNPGALYAGGGFSTACTGYTSGGLGFPGGGLPTSNVAWIFDRDGDVVWSYDLSETVVAQCTRARMSIDGKYMWFGNFGNTTPDGALMRIPMDGLGTPDEYSMPGRSHDFAILPDDHVVYFGRDDGGSGMTPESIYELDPATGATTLIYSQLTDFGDVFDDQGGHTNQVNYVPELNAIAFSMYFINTIALISYPGGQLVAAFGGDKSTFSNMSWNGQHGHDVYADHIDIFNNNGTNGGATVLRFDFDLQGKTATELPGYSAGVASPAFGDVKEQPNGNFFVTYSTASVMHEIDASMNLLRTVETTVTLGYVEHRGSLYGKPPPYGP